MLQRIEVTWYEYVQLHHREYHTIQYNSAERYPNTGYGSIRVILDSNSSTRYIL